METARPRRPGQARTRGPLESAPAGFEEAALALGAPYDLSAADYRRLAAILRILARSAARPVLVWLGLLRGHGPRGAPDRQSIAALVGALEELGPTFVKLGQIMGTRADLLPPELTDALGRLHDRVAPAPAEEIAAQLAVDLGAPPETVFAAFSPVPLAAASIAQVHPARLATGEEVVVKVRRPGIEAVMRADLRLLMAAARIVERRSPALRRHQPVRVVAELGGALLEELDFRIEARNQEEVRALGRGFIVPAVHPAYTTERTLVSTRIRGERPDAAFRDAHPALARALAPDAARGLLGMVLLDGVFHADPHPGNLLVTSEGRLALLDYGSVGRLSARRREQVLIVLGSLVDADAGSVSDVLLDWAGRTGAPPPGLQASVERFLERHARAGAGRTLRLAEAIAEFVGIARAHDLALPPDLVLLMRALGIAEGLARTLDPDVDVVEVIAPVVMRAFAARFEPRALASRGLRLVKELDLVLTLGPEALRRAIGRVRREGLTLTAAAGGLVAALDAGTPHYVRVVFLAAPLAGLVLFAAGFGRR